MANKMTQKDYFNEIVALATENNREDLVEFAKGRIAVLDKKSANRKPSKKSEENEAYKAEILATLESFGTDEDGNKATATVTEIRKASPMLEGLENQRVSALVRQLKLEHKVARKEVKNRAVFALA